MSDCCGLKEHKWYDDRMKTNVGTGMSVQAHAGTQGATRQEQYNGGYMCNICPINRYRYNLCFFRPSFLKSLHCWQAVYDKITHSAQRSSAAAIFFFDFLLSNNFNKSNNLKTPFHWQKRCGLRDSLATTTCMHSTTSGTRQPQCRIFHISLSECMHAP